ncbi:MAG: hypothetical protein ACK5NT_06035, partial [Pyrinomonadaceae bacterium]
SGSLVDIVLSKKKAAYADIDAALKNKTIQKPDAVRLKQVANGTMSKAEYELSSTSNPAEVVEIFGNAMNSASEDEKKRLRRALSGKKNRAKNEYNKDLYQKALVLYK